MVTFPLEKKARAFKRRERVTHCQVAGVQVRREMKHLKRQRGQKAFIPEDGKHRSRKKKSPVPL